jgi:undecaprenyl diphosphate synthase
VGLLDRFRKSRVPEQPVEPVGCVAIILDGNGRWAMSRGLPVAEGHREGTRALRRTVEAAIDLEIGSLVVYGFSTENWTRPPDEVDSLMEIFGETIDRELPDLAKQGVRVRFLGRRDRAPDELQEQMAELEARTGPNDRLDLWIAFDYGGRAELATAARRLVEAGIPPDEIDEDTFARALYEPELPDPDLLIRTAGDQRISNFLLWQAAYAELYFTDTYWPDFGREDIDIALAEYGRRKRKFGGLLPEDIEAFRPR